MEVYPPGTVPGRSVCRRWCLLAVAILSLVATQAAAERQLLWQRLAVEARLDAEGFLQVRESHTMVFTGDWNGGERIFDLRRDQALELESVTRVDPASGAETPMVEGDLSRVDHYGWSDRQTLRWRSRLPSDPPFDATPITYVLEYRQERVLQPRGGRYVLDHDFAFPDRAWPIESYTLRLELDPVWQPAALLPASFGPTRLGPGEGFLVTAELAYTGAGTPAGVRHLPPVWLRALLFLAAAVAMLALAVDFYRREANLGRFTPPPAPATIDSAWLEEHLFDLLPEEAGALWDRKVGPPEVAAILARWEAEGKIGSEVRPKPGRFQRDVMELELTADRDEFPSYERKLLDKLFFGGRRVTDTEAIRERYKSRGFDPAATVRSGIERQLARRGRELAPHKSLPGSGRRVTLGLFFAFLALMALEAIGRPLPTLQLALLLAVPLGVLYLLVGLVFASLFRKCLTELVWWSLGFVLPGLAFFAQMVVCGFFDRLLPDAGFPLQPGIAGTCALAVLAVMVWSSLLNNARSRERAGGLDRRQRLAAARRLFSRELGRDLPQLRDEWMPYLLALGLGPRVDHWWKRFGGAADAAPLTAGRFGSGSSGGGGSLDRRRRRFWRRRGDGVLGRGGGQRRRRGGQAGLGGLGRRRGWRRRLFGRRRGWWLVGPNRPDRADVSRGCRLLTPSLHVSSKSGAGYPGGWIMDRSWMPTAAGILNIVAGGLALLGALALIVVGTVTTVVPGMTASPDDDLPLALVSGLAWGLVVLCLLAALVAIVGGVVALRRTGWGWPLAGAITALFCAMPLGVFALIFVVMSEEELRGGGGKPAAAG